MFLRATVRRKDGKEHRYFSVVENKRISGGRVVRRQVLYLGEINDTQEFGWRKSIEVFEDDVPQPRTLSLFPEDRYEGLLDDTSIVRLRLSQMKLRQPRQWGACSLSSQPRRWGGLRKGQVARIVRCGETCRPFRVHVKAAFRPLEAI
jgi:hypothetical protein